MTIQALPYPATRALPRLRDSFVRELAIKTFYFSLVAVAFTFISMLLSGLHV
jgi:hypothetical protein